MIDLQLSRKIPQETLIRMGAAVAHRGPDEEGYYREPGIGLASRRLSIVDLEDGRQPVFNEDRSVVVVYNGELFDHVTQRDRLKGHGHQFRSACDTEVIVHLWEEHGEELFEHLRGQFAFALYDRKRRVAILARDRVGICPLHWARRGNTLYFGSEIKALLATGEVRPEADIRGLDHVFTFFGMPSRRTPFRDIWSVRPGRYLRIQFGQRGQPASVSEHCYWDLDFPDRGMEYETSDPRRVISEFRELFLEAVNVRLRADVPVVGYLSGGVDSAVIAAAARNLGNPIRSFTIEIDTPGFNEAKPASQIAKHIGSPQTIVRCDTSRLLESYQNVIVAAENPVVDTSCSALYDLATAVHRQGYKVVLSGEGSDEAFGSYPWFKINKALNIFDRNGFRPSKLARRLVRRLCAEWVPWSEWQEIHKAFGGPLAQADLYGMVSSARSRFFCDDLLHSLEHYSAFGDLELDLERMKRWHPHNQSLYVGYKTILPGLLLNHKSDRVAMANSVEARYPFLDERLLAFCAELSPRWKLRGILHDKLILRSMAKEFVPANAARRPKKMFRAPFADTVFAPNSQIVAQLLSSASLTKAGYFDPRKVQAALSRYRRNFRVPWRVLFDEMGLTAVFATQMWHHIFLGGGLCDLPTYDGPVQTSVSSASFEQSQSYGVV